MSSTLTPKHTPHGGTEFTFTPATAPPTPTVAPSPAPPADSASASHETLSHPTDWQYIKIALLLALLTAIEVFTYFESVHNLSDAWLIAVLVVLMVLKFGYVAAWFMHLKFDSKLFRRIFQVGIVLAVVVYVIMLAASQLW